MAYDNNYGYAQNGYTQYLDNSGKPLTGGSIETFIAGTTTPVLTFKDFNGGRNPHKITLDENGGATIILRQDTVYKFIIRDKNGDIFKTIDNIISSGNTTIIEPVDMTIEGTTKEIDVNLDENIYTISLADEVRNKLEEHVQVRGKSGEIAVDYFIDTKEYTVKLDDDVKQKMSKIPVILDISEVMQDVPAVQNRIESGQNVVLYNGYYYYTVARSIPNYEISFTSYNEDAKKFRVARIRKEDGGWTFKTYSYALNKIPVIIGYDEILADLAGTQKRIQDGENLMMKRYNLIYYLERNWNGHSLIFYRLDYDYSGNKQSSIDFVRFSYDGIPPDNIAKVTEYKIMIDNNAKGVTSEDESVTITEQDGVYDLSVNMPPPYSLPTASETVLGGIKVGQNLSIDDGVLSAIDTNTTYTAGENITIDSDNKISATDTKYILPTASATVLGGIKVGEGLEIIDGVLQIKANEINYGQSQNIEFLELEALEPSLRIF